MIIIIENRMIIKSDLMLSLKQLRILLSIRVYIKPFSINISKV